MLGQRVKKSPLILPCFRDLDKPDIVAGIVRSWIGVERENVDKGRRERQGASVGPVGMERRKSEREEPLWVGGRRSIRTP